MSDASLEDMMKNRMLECLERKIPASMYTFTTAWGGADTIGRRVC